MNTAFKGFGPLSPNSKQKQHERALVASRTKQVPHYAKRGAPPVIGRAAKRANKKKAGPVGHNRILAAIGKVVPCRKWGGWSGDGGDFERGVYGLVNARQVPAPKKVHVCTAVWNSLGFRSLISGAEQQKTMYHAVAPNNHQSWV